MILDISDIQLTPGDFGQNCLGNGKQLDAEGNVMECCCDECDYLRCCTQVLSADECQSCTDGSCSRAGKR